MARTKAYDYDSKRDAITNKAAKLFAEKGFSGASLSDISKACHVSKSLIYHYYPSKEDILFGIMKDHIDELNTVLNDTSLIHDNPHIEFHNLTQAIVVCYAGAENAQKVLLYDLNNLPSKQRDYIIEQQRGVISRFEAVYVRAAPELKDQPEILRTKIMLFFGMINWLHTWFNPKGAVSRNEVAKLAAETVLKEDMSGV